MTEFTLEICGATRRDTVGKLNEDIARYRQVKTEDVRAAAARWLRKDARVVLTVLPRGGAPTPPAQKSAAPAHGKRSK